MTEPLLIELSAPGRKGYSLPQPSESTVEKYIPSDMLRKSNLELPEVSEPRSCETLHKVIPEKSQC